MQGLKTRFADLNLSTAFLERHVMHEMLQTQDAGATVIHIRVVRVFIEKQWKSSALEWKRVFCVNSPKHSIAPF